MPEPDVCFVVFSYRDPDQVERLVRRLLRSAPSCRVVVRHDQHVTDLPASRLPDDRVTVLPAGCRVHWGAYDQVEALRHVRDHVPAWGGGASPGVLTLDLLPTALASGSWFARTFDAARHPQPLDALDALLDGGAVRP